MSSPLPCAKAIKITPGPKAAIIPGKGGSGDLRYGGSVPQNCSCAIGSVSLDTVDGALGERGEQLLKGLFKIAHIFRFQGHLDLIVRIIEHRIGTKEKLGKAREEIVKNRSNHTFTFLDVHDLEVKGGLTEVLLDGLEALVKDLGNTREDVDVTQFDHGSVQGPLSQKLGSLGHLGHSQPRLIDIVSVAFPQTPLQLRVVDYSQPESAGDARHGNIIVRWTNPTGGKDKIELPRKGGRLVAD